MHKKMLIPIFLFFCSSAFEAPKTNESEQLSGSPIIRGLSPEMHLERETVEELRTLPTSPVEYSAETPRYTSPKERSHAHMRLMLLEQYLKTHADSETDNALCHAYRSKNYPAAMKLLEHGANPNSMGIDQMTPLMYIASNKPLEAGTWLAYHHIPDLLRRGADPCLRNQNGYTALTLAITHDNFEVVAGLLNAAEKSRKTERTEAEMGSGRFHITRMQLEQKNPASLTPIEQAISFNGDNERTLAEITKCLSYEEIQQALAYAQTCDRTQQSTKYHAKLIHALSTHPTLVDEARAHGNHEFAQLLSATHQEYTLPVQLHSLCSTDNFDGT